MNIGVDVRCLMRGRYSGVAEYTYQLLTALFKIDQKNHYWLFYNSFSPVRLPEFNYPNVHYVGFKYPNQWLMASLWLFHWPKIDQLIAKKYLLYAKPIKFDLFFLPNLEFVALSPSLPLVLTMHDLSYELFPEFFSPKARLWHQLVAPPKLCLRAQKIISVSENTRQDILRLYHVSPDKVLTVYSGVDPLFRSLANDAKLEQIKNKYRLPSQFILGLGTLEPRKNWESLILAWQRAKVKYQLPHALVLIGQRGWLHERLFSLIRGSKFRQEVRYLGSVRPEDKVYLYNLASLFVYPSWYEGFGFPPLEASACGVPTIVANNSSLPEVCGEGALLVNADNVMEISEAIKEVLTNEPLRLSLKAKGLEQVKKFSWQVTAQQVLALFFRLKKETP